MLDASNNRGPVLQISVSLFDPCNFTADNLRQDHVILTVNNTILETKLSQLNAGKKIKYISRPSQVLQSQFEFYKVHILHGNILCLQQVIVLKN